MVLDQTASLGYRRTERRHARIQKILSEGGPTLTGFFMFIFLLVDEGREDPNTTISGP